MSGVAGGTRSGRGAWSRLALFAVLAALVHLLGCAHGPVTAGPLANAPMAGTPAPHHPAESHRAGSTAACAGRPAHGAAACTDTDEPSILPQRTDRSATPRTVGASAPGTTGVAVRNGPGGVSRADRDGAGDGWGADHRSRAALSVWRI
ncbi:hypothetical protein [Streptomyces sp. NPDC051569]|uniref:hypothetical protein n=1 Tax=Streptomyces sp. NPDC051569 TaxID=3365661 RepID=UPI0037A1C011